MKIWQKVLMFMLGVMFVPNNAWATVIEPPWANYWMAILKAILSFLVLIALAAGAVMKLSGCLPIRKKNFSKRWKRFWKIIGMLIALVVLVMAVIWLGKFILGKEHWFYRYRILSRFCFSDGSCL